MLLTEIKATGVNKVVEWFEKRFNKLGYSVSITFRGSPTKQYVHVISSVDSVTIRVLDPYLEQGTHESVDYDYTILCGTQYPYKDKLKLRPDKPNTSTETMDAVKFVLSKFK